MVTASFRHDFIEIWMRRHENPSRAGAGGYDQRSHFERAQESV